MKKVLAILLAMTMLMATFGTVSAFAEENGEAAAATPISTVADFEAMEQNGNYYLANDIDFGGKTYTTAYIVEKFDGTLDGKGHAIYGFGINSSGSADTGIFGNVGNSAVASIKDLTVGTSDENGEISVSSTGAYSVGVLGGAAYQLNIENVTVYGNVNIPSTTSAVATVGGFFGATKLVNAKNCVFYGQITNASTCSKVRIGAFSARNVKNGNSTVEGFVNYGDITIKGTSKNQIIGSVFGIAEVVGTQIDIINCVNYGTIKSDIADGTPTNLICAGSMMGYTEKTVNVTGCVNYGGISSHNYAAEYVASGSDGMVTLTNNVNFGKISGNTNSKVIKESKGNMNLALPEGTNGYAPSESVKFVGAQNSAVTETEDGKSFAVRFLSVIDGLEYTSVGYEISAYVDEDGDGAVSEWKYTHDTNNVYSKVKGTGDNGEPFEKTAEELGGNYIYALASSDVPASETAGTVVFIIKPFAKTASETLYGTSAVCVYNQGVCVSVSYAG